MKLERAIALIHGLALQADCKEPLTVRLSFANEADQSAFKKLIDTLEADSTIPTKALPGCDGFEVEGILVELANRDRGARALAQHIIEHAEKALKNGSGRTVRPDQILAMRQSLSDLLQLVRG
jgi:hypothetical protein